MPPILSAQQPAFGPNKGGGGSFAAPQAPPFNPNTPFPGSPAGPSVGGPVAPGATPFGDAPRPKPAGPSLQELQQQFLNQFAASPSPAIAGTGGPTGIPVPDFLIPNQAPPPGAGASLPFAFSPATANVGQNPANNTGRPGAEAFGQVSPSASTGLTTRPLENPAVAGAFAQPAPVVDTTGPLQSFSNGGLQLPPQGVANTLPGAGGPPGGLPPDLQALLQQILGGGGGNAFSFGGLFPPRPAG